MSFYSDGPILPATGLDKRAMMRAGTQKALDKALQSSSLDEVEEYANAFKAVRSKDQELRAFRSSCYAAKEELEKRGQIFKVVKTVVDSPKFESFFGVLIVANFAIIVLETDIRAKLNDYGGDDTLLRQLETVNIVFLCCYAVECVMRIYVYRLRFFRHGWNNFDAFLVVSGFLGEILYTYAKASSSGVQNLNQFRSVRMIRLLRISRVLISFQELYSLISGLTHCCKTLMWALGLIFMTLTLFSVVAVEYIHPLMKPLAEEGHFDCEWCSRAFQSSMHANLTFFQMVSGDGWSHFARILIETHPWTAAVFLGVIFIVCFGLLNLVIAAIVDTAARARENDIMNLASQVEVDREMAWLRFSKLVCELDKDDSGDISKEELREGLDTIPELKAYLSVMCVSEEDLDQLFLLLDSDGNGTVSLAEFAAQLCKIKTQDTKTSLYYIRRLSETIQNKVEESCNQLNLMSRKSVASHVAHQSIHGSFHESVHRSFAGPKASCVHSNDATSPILNPNSNGSSNDQSRVKLAEQDTSKVDDRLATLETLIDKLNNEFAAHHEDNPLSPDWKPNSNDKVRVSWKQDAIGKPSLDDRFTTLEATLSAMCNKFSAHQVTFIEKHDNPDAHDTLPKPRPSFPPLATPPLSPQHRVNAK